MLVDQCVWKDNLWQKAVWLLKCPLCEITTPDKYFEDDIIWIGNCTLCTSPIAATKKHQLAVASHVSQYMVAHLAEIADELLGRRAYYIDPAPECDIKHVHYHARRIQNDFS